MPGEDTVKMREHILRAIQRIEMGEENTLPYEPNKNVLNAIKSEVEGGFSSVEDLRAKVQLQLSNRITGAEGILIGIIIGLLLK